MLAFRPTVRIAFVAATLLCGIGLAGCYEKEDRWAAAQQESSQGAPAVSEAALPGATFNKFFPKQEGETDVVFKQEKTGFAQASLYRNNDMLGTMSIFDTRSNPSARDKYASAAKKIAGYPAEETENATTILVADRFQVQLQSEGTALTAEDRAAWLEKFDLAGLAQAF